MSDALKDTLELFRQKEKQLLAQLQSARLTIRNLEQELGIEGGPISNGEVTASPSVQQVEVDSAVISMPGRKPQIRADEFFGMTQAEAARKYLKKIGYAVSFDELAEALQSGGCKLSGANPKKVLYISLVRNTRDFVPPKPGFIGLREFYPGGGRLPKEKKEKTQKRRAKKPRATLVKRSHSEQSVTKDEAPPSQLADAVRAALSDKQLHSVEEIMQKVSAKLGLPVKKIGILGTLRRKDRFEKVDGQYRLLN